MISTETEISTIITETVNGFSQDVFVRMGQTRIAEAFGQRLITIGVCTCAVLIDRLPDGRRCLSHLAPDQRSAADIPDSALLINGPLTDNPNYIELAE